MAANPLEGLVGSVEKMRRELEKSRGEAAKAGADAIKKELIASAKRDNRSRFRGSKVGVAVKRLGASNAVGRAGRSAGAWAIANDGANAHTIGPKRGQALYFPDGGFTREPIHHPGTSGRKSWDNGQREGEAPSAQAVEETLKKALDRGFGSG